MARAKKIGGIKRQWTESEMILRCEEKDEYFVLSNDSPSVTRVLLTFEEIEHLAKQAKEIKAKNAARKKQSGPPAVTVNIGSITDALK